MNGTEWKIQAPARACSGCGRAFDDGESVHSSLLADPREGYVRRDRCAGCGPEADPPGTLSFWKTVCRHPPPPAPEAIRRETAETLLRRFVESGGGARPGAVFVLAVMLERRRTLVERDIRVEPGGRTLRVYEHRGTGETFLVVDPGLRLSDLEAVQREVMALLGPPPRGDGGPLEGAGTPPEPAE